MRSARCSRTTISSSPPCCRRRVAGPGSTSPHLPPRSGDRHRAIQRRRPTLLRPRWRHPPLRGRLGDLRHRSRTSLGVEPRGASRDRAGGGRSRRHGRVEPTPTDSNLIESADDAIEMSRGSRRAEREDDVRHDPCHVPQRGPHGLRLPHGPDLHYVHISDIDRLAPGQGRGDFVGLVQALKDTVTTGSFRWRSDSPVAMPSRTRSPGRRIEYIKPLIDARRTSERRREEDGYGRDFVALEPVSDPRRRTAAIALSCCHISRRSSMGWRAERRPCAAYYGSGRAQGGVGLIVTGSQAIHPTGQMSPRFGRAWDPAMIPAYRRIADERPSSRG